MAGEGIITVTGNVGSDAQLNKTPQGILVTSFNLANTPRVKKNNEWVDGETNWFRCFVWGKDATGAANEIRKGMRVVVSGRFNVETFTDKEGVERKALEINVDEYGIKPKNVTEPVNINTDTRSVEDPVDDPWM